MQKSEQSRRVAAVITHVHHEGLGLIERSLSEAAVDIEYFLPADPALEQSNHDFLIVMGGPWSVYDGYPGLDQEFRVIQSSVSRGAPVLGICLGAQAIAAALGASVEPCGAKEIGWYPLELTAAGGTDPLLSHLEPKEMVFQWHGDTFGLPPGAELLATSPLCPRQAFRYGRATYALQFHLEVTAGMIADWLTLAENREEVTALHGDDGLDRITTDTSQFAAHLIMLGNRVFSAFLNLGY